MAFARLKVVLVGFVNMTESQWTRAFAMLLDYDNTWIALRQLKLRAQINHWIIWLCMISFFSVHT